MKYNTGKKAQILKFLLENSARSFTLEEIAFAITPEGHGKSTVYRIVSELVEAKKIKRLSDGKTRHCTYQYIGNEDCHSHLHLKCLECGKLIHLDESISHEFCDALLSHGGFALEEGCMLFGKCDTCKPRVNDINCNQAENEHNANRDHGHGGQQC